MAQMFEKSVRLIEKQIEEMRKGSALISEYSEELKIIEEALSDILEDEEEYLEAIETLEGTIEELETLMEENQETPLAVYDQLKELGDAYYLSDSQIYQDGILRLLKDEFNIKLITAPARNA